ncbi:MAG: restriction endonuclease subunit S [Acidimicrobiales bacterium]
MTAQRLRTIAQLVTECAPQEVRPYVALEFINGGTGRLLDDVELPERAAPETGAAGVEVGDVLFGKLRPYLAKVWLADRAAFASTELLCLRPRSIVDSRWLYYLCTGRPLIEWAVATSDGTKMPRTSWEKLAEYRVSVPPLGEQRAIADFLDTETARIDALIEKKRRMVELLEERFVAAVDDMTASVPRIPLRRLASVTYGLGQPPPLCDSEEGIPIIRATNIFRGRIDAESLIRARQGDLPLDRAPLLRCGEILVVRSGAYTGDSALVTREWAGSAPGYDLRVTPWAADSRLLSIQMLGRRFLDQVDIAKGRAAQPHLNAEDLGDIVVAIEPLRYQREVAERLANLDQRRWRAVNALGRQISLLKEHRQALITAAVTGQLDISGVAA